MIVIYILFLAIWLCTLLGWIAESVYRKLMIKAIKEKYKGKIEWLKKAHGDNDKEIKVWKEAIKIIKKAEGK